MIVLVLSHNLHMIYVDLLIDLMCIQLQYHLLPTILDPRSIISHQKFQNETCQQIFARVKEMSGKIPHLRAIVCLARKCGTIVIGILEKKGHLRYQQWVDEGCQYEVLDSTVCKLVLFYIVAMITTIHWTYSFHIVVAALPTQKWEFKPRGEYFQVKNVDQLFH